MSILSGLAQEFSHLPPGMVKHRAKQVKAIFRRIETREPCNSCR